MQTHLLKNLDLTTYLACKGLSVQGCERDEKGTCWFVLSASDAQLADLVEQYFQGGECSAIALAEMRRRLIAMIKGTGSHHRSR